MNFAVAILAAGASTRMGRPKLLLPWGEGTVLAHLVATWRQLGAAQLAVVTVPLNQAPVDSQNAHLLPLPARHEWGEGRGEGNSRKDGPPLPGPLLHPREEREKAARHPLDAELDRLGLTTDDRIENPQPQLGMFSSIRCAAQWPGWQPGLTHWLLTLGDQPHVQTATLRALLDFAARHPDEVCQPARQGRPRHPVLLPRDVFGELASTSAENLKQFLLARPGQRVCFESGDAGLDFDLDEPADYERAVCDLSLRPGRRGCS